VIGIVAGVVGIALGVLVSVVVYGLQLVPLPALF
jgi:hypothetical protein